MATTRRNRSDSTSSRVEQMKNANNPEAIELPEGLTLRTKGEEVIWHQFTKQRAQSDWKPMDLSLLHKIVELEADLRKHKKRLDKEGVTLDIDGGKTYSNPLNVIIDTLMKQQLSLVRALSLTSKIDGRVLAKRAQAEQDAARTIKKVGKLSLLA